MNWDAWKMADSSSSGIWDISMIESEEDLREVEVEDRWKVGDGLIWKAEMCWRQVTVRMDGMMRCSIILGELIN